MKQPRPDPEEFARSVLWQLAGLRADVYETMLHTIAIRSWQSHVPATKIQREWRKKTLAMQERIYRDALKRAGLRGSSPTEE